ncbi:MAG: DNA-binding response regulator [Methylococcales bacterium]|nr:MAG: DNA-binding response regulator [Methylococcales bacterium]
MLTSVDTGSFSAQYIFILDDDMAMTKLLNIMLTQMGYITFLYSNAIDFLKAIPEVSPSILITDMNMPEMTGIEVQAEMARLERTMPIIFLSGESSVPQSITALKQGAVDFLLKPVNLQQLKAAVETAFESAMQTIQSAINKSALETRLMVLTPREREVYDLMILGYNNTEILETLRVSLPTAKQYKVAVMRKLKIKSLSALISLDRF